MGSFMTARLNRLKGEIRACRVCVTHPRGAPLPHEPRPVFQLSSTATLAICGQAPGTKVHASGVPFTDRSGDRLRDWLGLSPARFYDAAEVAIIPMGFCFPGQTAGGADLPPRVECALTWHDRLMAAMPQLQLVLAVGGYAVAYHMAGEDGETQRLPLWRVIADFHEQFERGEVSRANGERLVVPMPHPSWRNNHWLKKHPWFERDYLPQVRREVAAVVEGCGGAAR